MKQAITATRGTATFKAQEAMAGITLFATCGLLMCLLMPFLESIERLPHHRGADMAIIGSFLLNLALLLFSQSHYNALRTARSPLRRARVFASRKSINAL